MSIPGNSDTVDGDSRVMNINRFLFPLLHVTLLIFGDNSNEVGTTPSSLGGDMVGPSPNPTPVSGVLWPWLGPNQTSPGVSPVKGHGTSLSPVPLL